MTVGLHPHYIPAEEETKDVTEEVLDYYFN
jgi:hypothetical protein